MRGIFLCGLLLIVGCSSSRRDSYERFVPPSDRARAALEAALEAWQQDAGQTRVEKPNMVVQVSDSQRRPSQRLEQYEIEGEVPGNGPRCFAVRLKFAQLPREQKARFVVMGVDPLWVFRGEDYDMILRWDMSMNQLSGSGAASSP